MANDESLMSQDEIERLFSQNQDAAAPAKPPPAAPTDPAARTIRPWHRTNWRNC